MLGLYRQIMGCATPLLEGYLAKRQGRGKEDPARAGERRGMASRPRPVGRLIWCHAASVGESLSFLAVVRRLRHDYPDVHVLMTTGTVSSAKLMAERLPAGAFHQYVPVDHPQWTARFLDHWQPDLVLWAESEFWPNLVMDVKARDIPAALLNARMSQASFNKWRWMRGAIANVLSTFSCVLAQNEDEAKRFSALGARNVRVAGNLKYAADPLPADAVKKDLLARAIGSRPVVLFASTHAGEEEIAIAAHTSLASQWPDLLTIILPRHPHRGDDITILAKNAGLSVLQRSRGFLPDQDCSIYIADTLGEPGIFYSLCKTVVMGGSFAYIGGHNPIEPAQMGCAVICGPQMYNFKGIVADFDHRQALVHVKNVQELQGQLEHFLREPQAAAVVGAAAQSWTHQQSGIIDDLMQDISKLLEKPKNRSVA